MTRPHSSKLTLSQKDHGLELTHEEFVEADFQEPWRYERVNGRLVVMTPSGFEHNAAGQPFRNPLGAYEIAHPDIIEFVLPEAWVVIDENTDRIADIAVYLRSSEPQPASAERVPDMIFEIVSPTAADRRRDYDDKRAEYQRIGVREYVIVDRFAHRVLVMTRENGQYTERELGPNDNYTTPLLPGLAIPLAKVLE
jgi:Uma2 family endonuclease